MKRMKWDYCYTPANCAVCAGRPEPQRQRSAEKYVLFAERTWRKGEELKVMFYSSSDFGKKCSFCHQGRIYHESSNYYRPLHRSFLSFIPAYLCFPQSKPRHSPSEEGNFTSELCFSAGISQSHFPLFNFRQQQGFFTTVISVPESHLLPFAQDTKIGWQWNTLWPQAKVDAVTLPEKVTARPDLHRHLWTFATFCLCRQSLSPHGRRENRPECREFRCLHRESDLYTHLENKASRCFYCARQHSTVHEVSEV